MKWFKVDGVEYKVRVFEPEEEFTILYNKNTGRTLSRGAPMVLSPVGTFFNYTLTVGAVKGEEDSLESLWNYLSIPRDKAIAVVLPRGRKTLWKTTNENGQEVDGFYAYVSTGKRGIKRIIEDKDGNLEDVIYDSFSINFIATKAQVLPNT